MDETRVGFLERQRQRRPQLQPVHVVRDVAQDPAACAPNGQCRGPDGHPVDGAGLDALHGAQAVPVQHRALEQISDRREADVRMRPHVVVVLGPRGDRSEVIEEHERTDRLARERRAAAGAP